MSTIEYRKLFRADIVVEVKYNLKSSPLIQHIGFSKNLSATGLQMVVDQKIDKEALLELELFVPGNKASLHFTGNIVWQVECEYIPKSGTNYYSTRVRFLKASSKDVISLSDFITVVLKNKAIETEKKIIEEIEKRKN